MVIHRPVHPLAGESGELCRARQGKGTGYNRKMLRKVERIALGKQIYRRLKKRVLERDEWQ